MKKVQHKPSKRYTTAASLVDRKKVYAIEEAIALVKKTATTKFDASVDAHILLNINAKKGDQLVRSSASLPHGTGKTIRIAVLTGDNDLQKEAKKAGADIVGEKDLLEEIKAGKMNFDILVATPDTMKLLAPVAKVLGPKGLMPNPKDGTVTKDVASAVTNLKAGKINYKNDDTGNIHVTIGKASFDEQKLKENYATFMDSLNKAKPAAVKGLYIKSVSLTSSMGPGVRVAL
ncbi:MAG: 50S ribosomal protein L1 [bacterium]